MKKLLIVFLAISMLLCFCACATTPEDDGSGDESSLAVSGDESKEESKPVAYTFKVKVVDENGAPLEGATVQICKDSCVFSTSDADGIAGFNAEITEGYKLSVLDCPEGYEYTGEAEVYLDAGITEYTLTLNAKQ